MSVLTTAEIRNKFLAYFESNAHQIVKSSSLIPEADPTLLFVNSGMVQFKDCFLGAEKRPYVRATTCQKSLRISGKHNDLENVGRTRRHHTFFEMLGNFSFGDYFKEQAIVFAWKFLTEEIKLDKNRLWVTIFDNDDEAEELWKKVPGLLPGRILRCGAKDNFWQMGETGPCGPCTEIHYYLGEEGSPQSEADFRKDDGRYLEIWNLVFMQFSRSADGTLTPLPKPSVDTGAGLERVASVVQGVSSNYESDELRRIIAKAEQLSGVTYKGVFTVEDGTKEQLEKDVSLRVLADHARATAFLIADGILPGADGRGYVLRRLIRRAARHAILIGVDEPILWKLAQEVVAIMGGVYPELKQEVEKIAKVIKGEEETFARTLKTGLQYFSKEADSLSEKVFPGSSAFMLHDTYGFPLDLTIDIAQDKGLSVDVEGFTQAMREQKERSRSARSEGVQLLVQKIATPIETEFVGYENSEFESPVVAIFKDLESVASASEGETVFIVAKQTPFYAESGGQIGDTGSITTNTAVITVNDTQKGPGGTIVHICEVSSGSVKVGERVRLLVDEHRRREISRHHSAVHLLHQALHEVLGDHAKQAGSRNSDNGARFDVSHGEAITDKQLALIEEKVNRCVRANYPVVTSLMSIDEAKAAGAMALFGEKYGQVVRVVDMGPGSRELCGGTHVSRTGEIGTVLVQSQSALSSGVRRVEIICGSAAIAKLQKDREILLEVAAMLNSQPTDIIERIEKLRADGKKLQDQVEKSALASLSSTSSDLAAKAVIRPSGKAVVISALKGVDAKGLREIADNLRQRKQDVVVGLASEFDDKAIFLVAISDSLTKDLDANSLLRSVNGVLGSKGGGRKDLAQAGGGEVLKIDDALKAFDLLVE